MKHTKLLAGFLLLLLAGTGTAMAAEFMAPQREDRGNLTISGSETHRNLYTAGGNLVVQSDTKGDLVAAGGMLQITGNVEQDLLAAGGSVFVTGRVGGDARVAGGNVSIQQPIGGDLVAVGGNILVSNKAMIGGDVAAGVGNLTLEAPVAGSLRLKGGMITINSKISGDVNVRATENLVFGPRAEVTGKIVYEGAREAVIKDGAKISAIAFTKMENRRGGKKFLGLLAIASLIKLVAVALAAWLLLHFMPRRVKFVVDSVHGNFWKNAGLGFVGAIVVPVAIIVALITVIGSYAAIAVALWYGLALLLGSLMTVIAVGAYALKKLDSAEKPLNWQAVVIGAVVYGILWFIPFVGAIAGMILWLGTFGAMLRLMKKEIQEQG